MRGWSGEEVVVEWPIGETRRRGIRGGDVAVEGDIETAARLCDWRIGHGCRGSWFLSKVT